MSLMLFNEKIYILLEIWKCEPYMKLE